MLAKPQACVPCHRRKVRCDASRRGTPCTRCIDKNRSSDCVLVQVIHSLWGLFDFINREEKCHALINWLTVLVQCQSLHGDQLVAEEYLVSKMLSTGY